METDDRAHSDSAQHCCRYPLNHMLTSLTFFFVAAGALALAGTLLVLHHLWVCWSAHRHAETMRRKSLFDPSHLKK